MGCKYCGRVIDPYNGALTRHENACDENPDRLYKYSDVWRIKYPNERMFTENSDVARHAVKKRILVDKLIPYVCKLCGVGPEWMGEPMPLILDHENGINNDNRLPNLRFVCSNCDSQLDTYKARNKRKL